MVRALGYGIVVVLYSKVGFLVSPLRGKGIGFHCCWRKRGLIRGDIRGIVVGE